MATRLIVVHPIFNPRSWNNCEIASNVVHQTALTISISTIYRRVKLLNVVHVKQEKIFLSICKTGDLEYSNDRGFAQLLC